MHSVPPWNLIQGGTLFFSAHAGQAAFCEPFDSPGFVMGYRSTPTLGRDAVRPPRKLANCTLKRRYAVSIHFSVDGNGVFSMPTTPPKRPDAWPAGKKTAGKRTIDKRRPDAWPAGKKTADKRTIDKKAARCRTQKKLPPGTKPGGSLSLFKQQAEKNLPAPYD